MKKRLNNGLPGRKRMGTAYLKIFFLVVSLLLNLLQAAESPADPGVRVKWVDDGDTILLSDGRRIRYIGINSPEIDHPRPGQKNQKAEPFGYEARDLNREMVALQIIRLEFDKEHHDRYGRTLAYVFLQDGTFINEVMILKGLAYCLPRQPNTRYAKRLLDAQQEAMLAKRGLFRRINVRGDADLIGNIRSKRFHRPDCPFGKNVGVGHKTVFAGHWAAFYSGFAPCAKCKPRCPE
jgi:micrococcal nuclease